MSTYSNGSEDERFCKLSFPGKVKVFLLDWLIRKLILVEIDGNGGWIAILDDKKPLDSITKLREITWFQLEQCGTLPIISVLKCDNLEYPVVFREETLRNSEIYYLIPREKPSPPGITPFCNWYTIAQIIMWQQFLIETNAWRPRDLPMATLTNIFIYGCQVYDPQGNYYTYNIDVDQYWM